MPLSQQKRREILFQLLFSHDFIEVDDDESNEFMMKEFIITRRAAREIIQDVRVISARMSDIDAKITQYSKSYDFHRIPKIELTILRLATYEMLFVPSLPPKVSIAEAIRLARKYATAESSSFVNAVLDAIFQSETKTTDAGEAEHELSIPVHSE